MKLLLFIVFLNKKHAKKVSDFQTVWMIFCFSSSRVGCIPAGGVNAETSIKKSQVNTGTIFKQIPRCQAIVWWHPWRPQRRTMRISWLRGAVVLMVAAVVYYIISIKIEIHSQEESLHQAKQKDKSQNREIMDKLQNMESHMHKLGEFGRRTKWLWNVTNAKTKTTRKPFH